jgi:integrase
MAILKLALDKRRQKKNGTYPIVFTTVLNSKPLRISTGVSVRAEDFNEQTGVLKGEPKLTESLFKLESLYLKRLQLFLLNHPSVSCTKTLKQFLLNRTTEEVTILSYWNNVVDDLCSKKRFGGAKVHKQSISTIGKHLNLNIPFKDLSYRSLLELEKKLYVSGVSTNGMGVYFRSLRTVCNLAINEDIVNVEWYPFKKYKIKKELTTPRVLNKQELQRYFNLTIDEASPEYKYWCIGKLLFMLRGINITDLLMLTKQNINNERLIYRRSKTGKLYSIKLTAEIYQLLDSFSATTTLLGISELSELKSSRRVENITQRRKVINHHLAKIGESLGCREKLTTYVFRYSYANLAKQMGYSKDIIAEALGHEYGNAVTGIYLEQFDQEVVDKMNQDLIDSVSKPE